MDECVCPDILHNVDTFEWSIGLQEEGGPSERENKEMIKYYV